MVSAFLVLRGTYNLDLVYRICLTARMFTV